MSASIVYTRSRIALVLFLIVFLFGSLIGLGVLLDYYPDLEAVPGMLFLFVETVASFLLAQRASKAGLRLDVYEEYFQFTLVKDSYFAPKPELVIWYKEVADLAMGSSVVNGSYMRLSMRNGRVFRLYRNMFWLSREQGFYEAYVALQKALRTVPTNAPDGVDIHSAAGVPVVSVPASYHTSAAAPLSDPPPIVLQRRIGYLLQVSGILLFLMLLIIAPMIYVTLNSIPATVACVCVAAVVVTAVVYYGAMPDIKVYAGGIMVRAIPHLWSDIVSISLDEFFTNRYFLIGMRSRGIRVQFKDGKELGIHDSMYTDVDAVREFLQKVVSTDERCKHISMNGGHMAYHKGPLSRS